MNSNLKEIAKSYFRGVYEGNERIVNEYASDIVECSYPIFMQIFDQPVLKGKKSVLEFVQGFRSRWKDCQVTFHHTLAEGLEVVSVWSFQARRRDEPEPQELHKWGGITYFSFDEAGKIIKEIGEESTPGPIGRFSN